MIQSTLYNLFFFCGDKEAKHHMRITLWFVRLSCFAFAGATCILQNTG